MKCSHKLGHSLTPHSCFWWLFLLCTGLSWSFADGNGNSSTYQYIYNLTICELNGTAWLSSHFDWAVETFVLYPVATHIISLGFLTTSHFFDALGLSAVSTSGFTTSGTYSAVSTVLVLSQRLCALSSVLLKIAWLAAMPAPGSLTSLSTTVGPFTDGSLQ
uniref:Truncated envelope glycoprotein n=1 Tax=Porcine reproductive and respiratory syndrome virus TaxID=28344 RepID=A4GTQ7_PRRSV|nr:truncated envelope glycoprotein [Porcine reproductive and respiratory syndrome virus]